MNVYITERGLFSNDRHDYPISHSGPVHKVEAPDKVSDNYSVVREVEQAYVAENTPAYTVSISSMGQAALQSMAVLSKSFDNYYDQMQSDYLDDRTAAPENTEQTQEDRITDETADEGINGVMGNRNGIDTETAVNRGLNTYDVANEIEDRFEEQLYEPAEDDSLQTIYDNQASDIENEVLFEETEPAADEVEIVDDLSDVEFVNEVEEQPVTTPVNLAPEDLVEPGADRLLEPTIEEVETREQVQEATQPQNNPVIREAMAAYNFQMSYQINLAMTS